MAGSTAVAYSAGESAPAQLSKSWMALAPASIWARNEAIAMSASRSISCAKSTGSVWSIRFTLVKLRDGPPSMR